MKVRNKEMTLFFNSKNELGKKTLAYSLAMDKKLNRQDLNSSQLSTSVLSSIIGKLGITPKQLLDKSNPVYQSNLKGQDYDFEGWLNIIRKNPSLIKAPILLYKNKAILCETPSDVLRIIHS